LQPVCSSELAPTPLASSTSLKDPLPWMAAYTKYRHEKNVAAAIEGRGYESFVPLYTRVSPDSKKSELPLFPGYVFCRSVSEEALRIIDIPGVFSIVSFGTARALIPDHEIEATKLLLRLGLRPQPWPYLAPGVGQHVCLKTGPLRGIEGVVIENEHQNCIIVSVHLLKRSVAVKVDRTYL
jgi:transcription termination/antitermination protein NusG